MLLNSTPVKFQLDCGATVNPMPVNIYKIFLDPQLERLEQSQATLIMFNNSKLKPLGRVQVETVNPKNNDCFVIEYTVVPQDYRSVFDAQSIQQFRLMTINVDNIMMLSDDVDTVPYLLC